MKISASILIVYFSLLMSQPYVNVWLGLRNKQNSCHPAKMCCKEMAKQQHKSAANQSSTCNRDFCNPFVPCGVSISHGLPVLRFENAVLEVSKNIRPATNDAILSNYLSDCWRPPNLC